MLVTQDQNFDEVLNAKRVQLTYRHLKTIQHADANLENREPQAARTLRMLRNK